MARVRIGLSCAKGHFNYIGDLWEPVKDKDIDKLAERAALPAACEVADMPGDGPLDGDIAFMCKKPLGLPHVEDREREANQLARVGGRNISAGLKQGSAPPRHRGPLSDADWRRTAFESQRETPRGPSLCAVTDKPLNFDWDDSHHVLEKRLLHAKGLDHIANDPRNAMFVKATVHAGHTAGLRRITRDKIREETWAYAREIGSWAVQRLEEDYPLPDN